MPPTHPAECFPLPAMDVSAVDLRSFREESVDPAHAGAKQDES